MVREYLKQNVYDALLERLDFIFREFDNIYISFSGGKDSGLLLNLLLDFRDKHYPDRPIGVFHQDFEAQYTVTTEYIERTFERIKDGWSLTGSAFPWPPTVTGCTRRIWPNSSAAGTGCPTEAEKLSVFWVFGRTNPSSATAVFSIKSTATRESAGSQSISRMCGARPRCMTGRIRISGMPTICSTTITTSCMISITRPVSRSPRCGWRPPLTIIPKTLSICTGSLTGDLGQTGGPGAGRQFRQHLRQDKSHGVPERNPAGRTHLEILHDFPSGYPPRQASEQLCEKIQHFHSILARDRRRAG